MPVNSSTLQSIVHVKPEVDVAQVTLSVKIIITPDVQETMLHSSLFQEIMGHSRI